MSKNAVVLFSQLLLCSSIPLLSTNLWGPLIWSQSTASSMVTESGCQANGGQGAVRWSRTTWNGSIYVCMHLSACLSIIYPVFHTLFTPSVLKYPHSRTLTLSFTSSYPHTQRNTSSLPTGHLATTPHILVMCHPHVILRWHALLSDIFNLRVTPFPLLASLPTADLNICYLFS